MAVKVSCLFFQVIQVRLLELIGKLFDHVIERLVLGFKLLLLSYWDVKSLIPLDVSYHNEKGKIKNTPLVC